MKKVWAILIWGVLVFGIGTYLDKVREMLMMGDDAVMTRVVRFGIGLVLAVFVVLVGRWLRRWTGKRLGPGDWFVIGAVAWVIQGGYSWWIEPRRTVDLQIHDTMFVIAQWYLIIAMVSLFALTGVIYYLGRGMNRVLGYIHFFVTYAALYLLFWMKNFDPAYAVKGYLDWHEFQNYKMVSGAYLGMAALFVSAQGLFVVNLFIMVFGGSGGGGKGRRRAANGRFR